MSLAFARRPRLILPFLTFLLFALASGSVAGDRSPTPTSFGFVVQVGAFKSAELAVSLSEELKQSGYRVEIGTDATVHRVVVGPFSNRRKAYQALARLRLGGYAGLIRTNHGTLGVIPRPDHADLRRIHTVSGGGRGGSNTSGPTVESSSSPPTNQKGITVLGPQLLKVGRCTSCHQLGGTGNGYASDLAVSHREHSLAGLASLLWNHVPAVWQISDKDEQFNPPPSRAEMVKLFGALYGMRYFDPLGDAGRGKAILHSRKCGRCHDWAEQTTPNVPDQLRAAVLDRVRWESEMWRHGAEFVPAMKQARVPYRQFTEQEIVDVLNYLEHLPGVRDGVPSLPFGDPTIGAQLFQDRACTDCHLQEPQTGGSIPLSAEARRHWRGPKWRKVVLFDWLRHPDLSLLDLRNLGVSELSAMMWNHRKWEERVRLRRGGETARLEYGEMTHILTYLLDRQLKGGGIGEGRASRGERVFRRKGCQSCHSWSSPESKEDSGIAPTDIATGLAKHNRAVMTSMPGGSWPRLTQTDVADLIEYAGGRLLETDPSAKLATRNGLLVQAGAFYNVEAARAFAQQLETHGHQIRVLPGAEVHRVAAGPFLDNRDAQETLNHLRADGFSGYIKSASSAPESTGDIASACAIELVEKSSYSRFTARPAGSWGDVRLAGYLTELAVRGPVPLEYRPVIVFPIHSDSPNCFYEDGRIFVPTRVLLSCRTEGELSEKMAAAVTASPRGKVQHATRPQSICSKLANAQRWTFAEMQATVQRQMAVADRHPARLAGVASE